MLKNTLWMAVLFMLVAQDEENSMTLDITIFYSRMDSAAYLIGNLGQETI